jgi:hypothetical protein
MLFDELQFRVACKVGEVEETVGEHFAEPSLREHPFAEKWHQLSDRHALEASTLQRLQLDEQQKLIAEQRSRLVDVEFRRYTVLLNANIHTDVEFQIPGCFTGGSRGQKRKVGGSWDR